MELLKRQEDLEAMIQAQGERFIALQRKKTQVTSSFKHQDLKWVLFWFCSLLLVQREKRLGLSVDRTSEDRRPPSRVSSLKRKPSDSKPQRVVSSRDIVRPVSSGRRDWTTNSKPTLKLTSSPPLQSDSSLRTRFRSSRTSETDEDGSCSPASPTMRSNARGIIQPDLSTSPLFKSKSPPTSPPSSPSREDQDLPTSPSVKPLTRRSFQFHETSSSPPQPSVKSISEQHTQTSPPSSNSSTSPSKEIPLVDLSSLSSPTEEPWTRRTFQSEELSSSLMKFSAGSEENSQTAFLSSKPPLAPKPCLPSRDILSEDLDPKSSLTVKSQSRRTSHSDETPSSLKLSIDSTNKEALQTSPPSSPEPVSSTKATSTSTESPPVDLSNSSRPAVKSRSRRPFQSDETSGSPLQLPFKSTSGEPQETSPLSSPKRPSSSKSSKEADKVDGRPRSKPPLAPKPKFISSEVAPSHHLKKTSPPSRSPPFTRRFPAPTEPPPPPLEKRSSSESSPHHANDLDGSGSSPVDVTPPDSPLCTTAVTEDDSVPSSPLLASSDVLQKDEGRGLCSSKQEVETTLKHFVLVKTLNFSLPSWQAEDRREIRLEGILEIKLKQVANKVRVASCFTIVYCATT